MSKLYFRYGAMGCGKTMQLLQVAFNYEERGMKVWLIKPAVDTRDGYDVIMSRIGLAEKAQAVSPDFDMVSEMSKRRDTDVIIADEAQFFSEKQIDQLRFIVDEYDIPVMCFGLRTDFLTHMFPGSKRLLEVADSITEIKAMCECGRKAIVNARIDEDGRIITEGTQVFLGGNDSYVAMCHACWKKKIKAQELKQ